MLDLFLLFTGAFLAAAVSGAAGFGGALLLLPLLTRTVGAELAIPLLTLAQLVGNLSRMVLGFRQIRWRPVGIFLAVGLPAAVTGALCFLSIPKPILIRVIGTAILGFVILRLAGRWPQIADTKMLLLGGAVTGFLSGLIGSAGPLGASVFLSLNLPPVAYIASEAATALALHAVKTIMYQHRITFPAKTWLLAYSLGVAMMLGTWASRRLLDRVHPDRLRWVVTFLLGLIAVQMLIWG